jgi:hypothetical protein
MMTKAYKVVEGHETDYYGYPTNIEIAKYFFNKEEAEAEYKKGEYTRKETAIYTTYKDGTVGRATTGAKWYEKEKARAKANERVELETVVANRYTMEEIEIN